MIRKTKKYLKRSKPFGFSKKSVSCLKIKYSALYGVT